MAERICILCHIGKDEEDFPVVSKHPTWKVKVCKECKRERDNEYSRLRNIRDKDKVNARNKKYYEDNVEKVKIRTNKYLSEHRTEIREMQRRSKTKNIDRYLKKGRERAAWRRAFDIEYNLCRVLRARVRNALCGQLKADTTKKLLGCSVGDFKSHLEKLFLPGMNWSNYGLHGWHIDHIRPCCSFDLSKPEEQVQCFHYTNMQPLWARDNLSKSGKLMEQTI